MIVLWEIPLNFSKEKKGEDIKNTGEREVLPVFMYLFL